MVVFGKSHRWSEWRQTCSTGILMTSSVIPLYCHCSVWTNSIRLTEKDTPCVQVGAVDSPAVIFSEWQTGTNVQANWWSKWNDFTQKVRTRRHTHHMITDVSVQDWEWWLNKWLDKWVVNDSLTDLMRCVCVLMPTGIPAPGLNAGMMADGMD